MKKLFLLSMLGLLLVSCSEQETVSEGEGTTPPQSSFLSISIVSGGSTGTRAETNGDYTQGGGTYRDGTEEESYVKDILFLFYDANGKPAEAIKNGNDYLTYSLWENVENTTDKDHSETVEQILNTTITITIPRKNDELIYPEKLVAVVNPPADYKTTLVGKDLDKLTDIVADYETGYLDRAEKTGRFIMTNSVYVNKNDEIVKSTHLEKSDFYSDAEATDHPVVVVYVERVLARIDLGIDIKSSDNNDDNSVTYKKITPTTGDPYYIYFTGVNTAAAEEDRNVYVRFLGWNVYNTPDKSYLIKEIDKAWEAKDIFGSETEPWNVSDYHRSFWAINPQNIGYRVGPFKDLFQGPEDERFSNEWTANKYKIADPGKYTTAYFQENAAPYGEPTAGPTNPSSVIIAAQLVNKDGTARELAKWGGEYYAWDDLLKQFCNSMNYWYRTSTTDDNTGNTTYTYTHISPDDLTWENVENSSNVNIVLNDDAEKKEWYTLKKEVDKDNATTEDFDEVEASAINTYITDTYGAGNVKYWREGYTYFSAKIRHLGLVETAPGYYGVVRNHIYEATITSVKGLGTPVVNPENPIVIRPQDEEANLSAEVRILSWRVVKQDYDLNW